MSKREDPVGEGKTQNNKFGRLTSAEATNLYLHNFPSTYESPELGNVTINHCCCWMLNREDRTRKKLTRGYERKMKTQYLAPKSNVNTRILLLLMTCVSLLLL